MATAAPKMASRRRQHLPITRVASRVAESAGYWLSLSSVYALFGSVFYYAFKSKLFDDDGTAPAGVAKQFDGTIVDSFPGIDAAWVILGLAQGLIVLGLAVSLAAGEFLPTRRKPLLLASLSLGMLTFAALAFGQSLTSQFDSEAQLFAYMAGTAVLFVFIRMLPPYRAAKWLSGSDEESRS